MAIHKVVVTTERGKLAQSFTNGKAAREFARLAAHDYGWGNVQEQTPIVSFSSAEKALKDLYAFGKPVSA